MAGVAATTVGVSMVLSTGPAQAEDPTPYVLLGVGAALAVTDYVFVVHDFDADRHGEIPTRSWRTAQIAVAAPQALVTNFFMTGFASVVDDDEAPLLLLGFFPTAGVTALTAHGIWAAASDRERPGVLVLGSAALGADATLSLMAIARAFDGRFSSPTFGVTQMVVATPQIIGSALEIRDAKGADRNAWIALEAWSSALFVHGAASLMFARPPSARDARPPPTSGLASVQLAPAPIGSGLGKHAPALGVSAIGTF